MKSRKHTPKKLYGDFFVDVQTSDVLPDRMLFVDAVPLDHPKKIRSKYARAKKLPDFSLQDFIEQHTLLPHHDFSYAIGEEEKTLDIREYIRRMWKTLTRESGPVHPWDSLIPLPYRSVVPGGRFRQCFYWDSYFTLLGLLADEEDALAEDMVRNFAYVIRTYGFIPNGMRTYYLTRSQPPVFALMVECLARSRHDDGLLVEFLPELDREYSFWMNHRRKARVFGAASRVVSLGGGMLLNRYWDNGMTPREESYKEDFNLAYGMSKGDAARLFQNIRATGESGWDFSSRWLADGLTLQTTQTIDIVPIDLNAFLYCHETILAEAHRMAGQARRSLFLLKQAEKRRQAIRTSCWNEEKGWYMDIYVDSHEHTPALTLAGIVPLFAGIPTQEEAARIAQTLEQTFLRPGGLVTSLTHSGQQWDAPNGWAPLHYLAIAGLERYGFNALAEEIAKRWITLNMRHFEATGMLHEKYNVENPGTMGGGGEYAIQSGFGWTNGVLAFLMDRYCQEEVDPLSTSSTQ